MFLFRNSFNSLFTNLTECEEGLERGAEFIGTASYLVWLKSKTLLPRTEQILDEEETVEDPHFEIIHHLIDYCRFKQAAKELDITPRKATSVLFSRNRCPGMEKTSWASIMSPLKNFQVSLKR